MGKFILFSFCFYLFRSLMMWKNKKHIKFLFFSTSLTPSFRLTFHIISIDTFISCDCPLKSPF
jgi:hypothetical protein